MSESVMLVLIGGRSAVPAIAGVLQFIDEIDRVKFLLCNDDRYLNFQKNVETALKQEDKDLLCDRTDVKSVDPNKFDDVYTAVDELCKNVNKLKYVNLTTVPQTMAISVYSYVESRYKDALIFSVNTDQSKIIPLTFGKPPISFNKQLSVENYIAMYGFNIFKNKLGGTNASLESLARYFVERNKTFTKILSLIRSKAGGGESIKAPRGFKISKQEFAKLGILQNDLDDFFNKLEREEIVHGFKISNEIIYFQIKSKEDYAFLAGDWLEVFVYGSAKDCGFDSVKMGIELDNYRGELDVFALNNANAMICECKTGKFSSDALSELSSKAEKLGGNYCVKLFITSDIQVSEEFLNQAKNNQIRVVSGNQLSDMNKILEKEMQNPTYQRR